MFVQGFRLIHTHAGMPAILDAALAKAVPEQEGLPQVHADELLI